MIITCEYCGNSITLGNSGWANIQKQTMLPLKIPTTDEITSRVRSMMDHRGNKIILVVDGNSGNVINSMGL